MNGRALTWFLVAIVWLLIAPDLLSKEAHLQGTALKDLMGQIEFAGTSALGSKIRYSFYADGSMKGIASHHTGEYHDIGRWWISDDRWCRTWELWDDARIRCIDVFVDGAEIRFVDEDGTPLKEGTFHKRKDG